LDTEEKDRLGSVAKGAKVLLPATIVGTALILGHDMLVNGILSTAEYGVYTTCKRILQIGFLLSFVGLENAVIHFVSKARGSKNSSAARGAWRSAQGISLAVGGVLSAALVVWAEPIGALVQRDGGPELAMALRVLAITLPLASIRMLTTSASQGLLIMWPKAVILQLLWPAVNILGVVWFSIVGDRGLEGVLWAYDLSMLAGALSGLIILLRQRPDFAAPSLEATPVAKSIMAFALPLWVFTLVNAAYAWGDQLLLAGLGGMEAAGQYAPVATLAPLFGLGLTALNGIFAPVISRLHEEGEKAELHKLYKVVSRWSLTLGLPLCIGALVAPAAVISVWPEGREEAHLALQIIALCYIPGVAVGSVNYMLIMSGHQTQVLWNGIPGVVVNIGLAVWLIPTMGVTGAAIANGVALVLISLIASVQVWYLVGAQPISKAMWKPALCGLPAAVAGHYAASYCSDAPGLLAVAIVGLVIGVVFFACLYGLGLESTDRDVWKKSRVR
jgi:O-antigen/teichoic acid export membrane protein